MKSHYRSEQEGLIEALLRELPARSREDVEGHEQWHTRYLHLLEEKKAAIAEWREGRKVNLDLHSAVVLPFIALLDYSAYMSLNTITTKCQHSTDCMCLCVHELVVTYLPPSLVVGRRTTMNRSRMFVVVGGRKRVTHY